MIHYIASVFTKCSFGHERIQSDKQVSQHTHAHTERGLLLMKENRHTHEHAYHSSNYTSICQYYDTPGYKALPSSATNNCIHRGAISNGNSVQQHSLNQKEKKTSI